MAVVVVALVVFTTFLYCCQSQIELGVELMNVATRFLSQRKATYLASLWVFFLAAMFFVFWIFSVIAVQSRANKHIIAQESTRGDQGIMGYFVIMYIFMAIFFNYVLTFLIATSCGLWHYGIEGNYWCEGTGRINRYHVGSITFAAILVVLMRVLSFVINSNENT